MNELWAASIVLLWIVVVVQGVLLPGSLRQIGLVQLRLGSDPGALITTAGLPRGAAAPPFDAEEALTGRRMRLADFVGRRLMIVFLSPTCLSCKQLIPHLNRMCREYDGEVTFLVVCHANQSAAAGFARLFKVEPPVLVDTDNLIAERFGISATPFAFVLSEDHRVLIRGIANDWTQLESLLKEEGTFQRARGAGGNGRVTLAEGEQTSQSLSGTGTSESSLTSSAR